MTIALLFIGNGKAVSGKKNRYESSEGNMICTWVL